jgi:hypothetical protein
MDDTNDISSDAGSQGADNNSVADNQLGKNLDEASLADFLRSSFLNEKEEPSSATTDGNSVDEDQQQEGDDQHVEDQQDTENTQAEEEDDSPSKGVQKRISKLVAAKKAAQAENEQLKARLTEIENKLQQQSETTTEKHQTQSSISDEILQLDTAEKVKSKWQEAYNLVEWCERNAEGATIGDKEFSSSDIREIKLKALRVKDIDLPQRFQYLQAQDAAKEQAIKDFPWINKPESEEYRAFQHVIKEFPAIKSQRPDWMHVAGLVVLGMKAYSESRKAAQPKPQIKKAPVTPEVKAPIPAQSKTDLGRAKQNFAKNPSELSGVSDLIKAMGIV